MPLFVACSAGISKKALRSLRTLMPLSSSFSAERRFAVPTSRPRPSAIWRTGSGPLFRMFGRSVGRAAALSGDITDAPGAGTEGPTSYRPGPGGRLESMSAPEGPGSQGIAAILRTLAPLVARLGLGRRVLAAVVLRLAAVPGGGLLRAVGRGGAARLLGATQRLEGLVDVALGLALHDLELADVARHGDVVREHLADERVGGFHALGLDRLGRARGVGHGAAEAVDQPLHRLLQAR